MRKNIYSFSVKSISLLLSGVLLFQCSIPAYAQFAGGFDYGVNRWKSSELAQKSDDFDAKVDNVYLQANIQDEHSSAIKNQIAEQKQIIAPLAKKLDALRADGRAKYGEILYPMYVSAAGSKTLKSLSQELLTFLQTFFTEPSVMSYTDFEKEYNTYITKEAQAWAKKNNYVSPAPYAAPEGEVVDFIKAEYPCKKLYAEYAQYANAEIKWHQQHKTELEEAAYGVLREYVQAFGPENITLEAARLLLNLKLNGKDVITKSEKNSIYFYVFSRLEKQNLDILDIGLFTSKKESKSKVAGILVKDIVELITLGAYVAPDNDERYATAVTNMIYMSEDTIAFNHILNVGFSALLALGRYDQLNKILFRYTDKENQGADVMDYLSFQYPVSVVQNAQGKYLTGKPSLNAQYATDYVYGNAFTDIAMILAHEGSAESLDLLRKYSSDKGFKSIMPFLVGALLSGKAGAKTDEKAKKVGLTGDEYLAMRVANFYFGDIEAVQEYDIDKALAVKYPNIKKHLNSNAILTEFAKTEKQKTRRNYAYANRAAISGDIAFMVWATFDLARLAGKALSLSKATYISVKTLKIADPALRMKAITANMPQLKRFVSARNSLRAFSARIRGGMQGVVLAQRELYTSEAIPKVMGAGKSETTVAKALGTATYDAGKGAFVINSKEAYNASYGNKNRVLDIIKTKKALQESAINATENFNSKTFINKYKRYKGFLSGSTRNAFLKSGLKGYSLESGLDFAYGLREMRGIKAPAAGGVSGINWLSRPFGTETKGGMLELYHRVSPTDDASPLPVNITIEKKIPTIKAEKVTNVLLTGDKESSFTLSLEHENKIVNPAFFKIGIADDSFVTLSRLTQGGSTPLNVKFMAEHTTPWGKFVQKSKDLFTSKDKLFSGSGSVWIKDGSGALKGTPITLSTPKSFDGVKVLINEDNTISVLGRNKFGQFTNFKNPYSFALPKGQLGNFAHYAKGANFNNPLNIALTGARNKVNTLFAVQFLSLSAASTGLIGALRANYPEMSNTEESLITVVLPYAPSFLSPVWAPFVKRFGSSSMMISSLLLAGGSLALSSATGFNGFKDANIYNVDKPALTPLIVSASLIGLSSSITRASFNPLMNELGGGVGLLKGMAFKNLSSFAMILPPAAFTAWDMLSPRYYTEDGKITGKPLRFKGETILGIDGKPLITKGQEILDSDGKPRLHSHTDFSISNPVLLAITGGVLYKFYTARMPGHIGKVEGYTMSSSVKGLSGTGKFVNGFNAIYRPIAGTVKESWSATKVLGKKEVWPVTLGGFGALGVEAALFNKYSQNEANNYLTNDENLQIKSNIWRPIVATTALAVAPFAIRYYSKPIVKVLGGDKNPMTYKKLVGISLGTAAVGTGLLTVEDDPYTFAAGMALVGMGFANTTNGFLKIGEFNLKNAKMAESVLTDWKVAYPAVHIGMSLIPLAHNYAADVEVNNSQEEVSKIKAMQNNMWIPGLTLAGTAGLYAKGAGLFKAGQFGRYIAPIKHGAAIAYPYFRLQDWNSKNFGYQQKPLLLQPQVNEGFKPLSQPVEANFSNMGIEEPAK